MINSAFDDREDIAGKRGAFIGQGKNVICYFSKLGSQVRKQLFYALAVDDYEIVSFCAAWRRAIRRIWLLRLPPMAHCALLHHSEFLPLHDEICRSSYLFFSQPMSHIPVLVN